MGRIRCLIYAVTAAVALYSCSTTRVLQDGEYRLQKNTLEVTNDRKFNSRSVEPYIKQKPNASFFGWNPFLNLYNMTNGKGKGWDKFVRKVGVAPVVYDPDLVESSIDNITGHLEYLGYYNSKVESEVSVKKRRVKVNYAITLGKRFPIKELEFELPEGELREEFLKDTASVTIKKGSWLSEASLESESDRSSKYLRDRGFYGFSKNYYFFEADTLSCPDSAILKMSIRNYTRNETEKDARPLQKFYIGDVSIIHPKSLKIREKILTNLNTIIPGELYREKDISNTYSRLSALNVFSGVNIEMNQSDTTTVDCSINLTQSKLQGFKVNLEASSNSTGLFGVSPQLSYYHKNIFRGGEWLNLSFMGNFQFKFNDDVRSNEFGVSAGISFPKFLFLPYRLFKGAMPRTEVSLSYNYQNRPEYTRNIISTSLAYTGIIGSRIYYQFYPVQLNIVRLFNLDPAFFKSLEDNPFMRNAYQDHFDLGLGGNLYYTTNAEVVPKTSFFYTRLQFDIAGNLLSAFNPLMRKDANGSGMIWNTPYSQYVRAEFQVGKTWRFGKNNGQALATRFLAGAGYAYGNSTALPFEKHFYAGGANSLRGWQARTVGPGTSPMDSTFVIPNQTGDMKLEANVEYRFNIVWKLGGAVFVDAGNVWTIRDTGNRNNALSRISWQNFGKSIAMNWGAGVRLDLNFLLLRVDLGMKIHDPARAQSWVGPGEWLKRDGFAIHFGVGYPF
ncbi:MAG: BamA/TamA family outer membrane protein [Bacteroidetes bacterium]|uniref:BamA/TamA family outer membrane protein n=1 Tax=Candidatus Cryptobacteroides excrementipullorum TaxID=2840761 RepID=A0A9D9NMP1_9BACT|nr:BamA/TamA family outer membrane protein [Candidatus Cryptobacteroides excrementipullorum]